ncbi:MAG: HDOD domain-containing protein [Burkholderiales bacterium]|nr:HDOD domain-containing protein [Burkholderiales bacterium]
MPPRWPLAAGEATLAFLLRRMRHTSDFPALSESIASIQSLSNAEHDRLDRLAEAILKDVALTHKLLRVVNAAGLRRTGEPISTVSRAIALIGYARVRDLATSLLLVEHLQDKQHAQQLKEEFVRAVLAGTLADELCQVAGRSEEAYLAALMRNLGRLLAEFYLPQEAAQVRERCRPDGARAAAGEGIDPGAAAAGTGQAPGVASGGATAAAPVSEARASEDVLGLSYDALGAGVGRHWGLADSLLQLIAPPLGPLPGRSLDGDPQRLRWLASAANEAADALFFHPPDVAADKLRLIAMRYDRALGAGPQDWLDAAVRARQRLAELSRGLELKLTPGSMAERLLDAYYVDAPQAGRDPGPPAVSELGALDAPRAEPPAEDAAAILTAGIQDITATLVEPFALASVLRMVLETLLRALGARRVVFCLRDARAPRLVGRFGLGERAQELAPRFDVALLPPGPPAGAAVPDLFSAIALKGVDTLIEDASAPGIAARLPPWFRQELAAPTFLLLPLALKQPAGDKVIGLIYADQDRPGGLQLDERELALVRTLRNQAVMAFRMAG